jgi:inhibitor of KinA
LTVDLADRIEEVAVRRIHRACGWLAEPPLPGVAELVPAATTITLFYSPQELLAAGAPAADLAGWLAARVRERLATLPESNSGPPPRLIAIPVCYGGQCGPDLEAVAARVGLSTAEVISRHRAAEYFVLQLGFAPGFPYLHGSPEALSVPRRDTPRTEVPAGSVGIANGQSCIYPVAIPGGWNLIGRTPLRLFRPERQPPALLQAGDRVQFRAISPDEFEHWEQSS